MAVCAGAGVSSHERESWGPRWSGGETPTPTEFYTATCLGRKALCPVGTSLRSGKCRLNKVKCHDRQTLDQLVNHVLTHNDSGSSYSGARLFRNEEEAYFNFCAEFSFEDDATKGGKFFYAFQEPSCPEFNRIGLTVGFLFSGGRMQLWAIQSTGNLDGAKTTRPLTYTIQVFVRRTIARHMELTEGPQKLCDFSEWGETRFRVAHESTKFIKRKSVDEWLTLEFVLRKRKE